jgi:hypothetical protein
MNRTAPLFILVVILLLGATPLRADTTAAHAYVLASKANIRKAPKAKATLLGKLSIGTKVDLLQRANGWVQVRNESLTGWTLESLLADYEPTLERLKARYLSVDPKRIAERRTWAERAAAVAPRNPQGIQLLIEALSAAGATEELKRAKEGLRALAPIYFSNGTYSDDPIDATHGTKASQLSCRKQVIRTFTRGAKRPDKTPWETAPKLKQLWRVLHKHCPEFHPDRTLWSLVANEKSNTARWQNIPLQPVARVRTYIELPCEDDYTRPPNGDFTLEFKPKQTSSTPALFLSSFHAPASKEVPFITLKKAKRVPISESLYKTVLHGTESAAGVKEVFIETTVGTIDLDGRPLPNSPLEEKLVVVWDSGERLELFGVKSYHMYSFVGADIQKVILTDSNADGTADFIIHADHDEHVLIELENKKIKSKRILEKAELEPVGGC